MLITARHWLDSGQPQRSAQPSVVVLVWLKGYGLSIARAKTRSGEILRSTTGEDVGVPAAQGAGGGAIAGGSLYLLTNSTNMAAPAAGAFVSGLMGIGSLLRQYHSGKIDGDEFVDMSQMVVVDAAIVGLASMTGQALIPIPVLGAFVGSIAGKLVASAITEAESELVEQLHSYEQSAFAQLDEAHQAYIQRLDAYFGNLRRLADVAFDDTVNTCLRLDASVRFAEDVGVPDDLILRTTDDLDTYMLE